VSDLVLRIGDVIVETTADRTAAARIPAVLREAFAVLGELLAGTPVARWQRLEQHVLVALEIELATPDELLGPRGAARLAERLHAHLIAEVSCRPR